MRTARHTERAARCREREVTDETSYDSYLIAAQLDKVVAAAEALRPNESKEDVVERQMTEVLHTIDYF